MTLEGRSRQERQAALVSARAGIDVRKGSKAAVRLVKERVRFTVKSGLPAGLLLPFENWSFQAGKSAPRRLAPLLTQGESWSDQKVLFHPHDAGRVALGDDRPLGHNVLRDHAGPRAGRLAGYDRGHTSDDGAAVDEAGRVAHGRQHLPIFHRPKCWRHRVAAADLDACAVVRLHDVVGGERHVVVVEEGGVDLRELAQKRFPDMGDLVHVPVARRGVHHLHLWVLLGDVPEAPSAALCAGVAGAPCVIVTIPRHQSRPSASALRGAHMNSLSGRGRCAR